MSKLLDDPRLTAYALGELPENQIKEFEMKLKNDPVARQEVESIQELAKSMEQDLGAEKTERLTEEQVEKIHLKTEDKPTFLQKYGRYLNIGLAAFALVIFGLKFKQKSTERLSSLTSNIYSGADSIATELTDTSSSPRPRIAAKRGYSQFAPNATMGLYHDSYVAPQPMKERYPIEVRGTNNEQYEGKDINPWKTVATEPLSTFSIDVDTASYANMRRFLNSGKLPPKDSVRVEEFINYFNYDYPNPTDEHPFSINTKLTTSPWNKDYKIVKVGLKGKDMANADRPKSNLVFLLDVSGSMSSHNKLPLLREAMKMLLRKLGSGDKVAIVVYAGASGLVLDSTAASEKATILGALNKLQAGGSTNAGAGIDLAYKIAQQNYIKGGVNRVLLATDGDFNVGTTSRSGLLELIKEKADDKIFLTVLGLGMGNYKDAMLESIANKGNGNYFYLDTQNEAKKVLVHDISSTLVTIAKDVKIQVEFNPENVKGYRLIGYENRMLAAKDFNDDKKDAGEIGAGHTVTALYEIIPSNAKFPAVNIDKLKYQKTKPETNSKFEGELLTVKLRYKQPEGKKSKLVSKVVQTKEEVSLHSAGVDLKFALSVASFGMFLRQDENIKSMTLSKIVEMANDGKGHDPHEYRQEFIELMELAESINTKK